MTGSQSSSEAYLAALARRAFLRLWSYPNLFIHKGGRSKELSDLLVMCDNDLVIFSDKDVELSSTPTLSVGWSRWYRKAVITSAGQVRGAERAILRGDKLFLDAACKQLLEVATPRSPRFHRVLTVRGAAPSTEREWGGRGSLMVTGRPLADCADAPFRLGATQDGDFFHVFDQNALDAVLTTLDTITDFVEYLSAREALLRSRPDLTASSEEDLLAVFMMGLDEDTNRRRFEVKPEVSFITGDHWSNWLVSEQCQKRDARNKQSYVWDEMVERFTHHALAQTQEFTNVDRIVNQEPLLRWFSRESRLGRRLLANSILEMLRSVDGERFRRRYHQPISPGGPYWVLLAMLRPANWDDAMYRRRRRDLLSGLMCVVKHLHPDAQDIVGLAVGGNVDGFSEDAMCMDCRDWPEASAELGRSLHEDHGLFAAATRRATSTEDYPAFEKVDA